MISLPVGLITGFLLWMFFPWSSRIAIGATVIASVGMIQFAETVHGWLPDTLAGRVAPRVLRGAASVVLFLCLLRVIIQVVFGPFFVVSESVG